MSNVQTYDVALGNKRDTVYFTNELDTTNHITYKTDESAKLISVEVDTLNNLLKETFPTLIKIDVEGYEVAVLEGATEILHKDSLKALIIEFSGDSNRYGFSDLSIIKILKEYGFHPFKYDPLTRCLTQIDVRADNSSNTLFIRKDAEYFVRQRINEAPFVTCNSVKF